ncbi:alpha-galactosidase [Kribbella monticola]|uniref:alpha-galactosidase n=1 Tax=Kribbella monticola TaxID=2185285 RepID=UPI001E6294E5|nr:alpha-galactosidase [Kribbella monticola]
MSTPRRRTAPPMGWNSWDCYGSTVTEEEVLANARFMAEHLLPYGWDTVVIDILWYEPAARSHGYNDDPDVVLDDHGQLLPAPNRFPSSAGGNGFAPLAAEIHRLGLRFGVHMMRGIPRRAVERDLPIAGTPWTARDVADTSSVCPWNPNNYGLDHDHPGASAYYEAQVGLLADWGVDFIKGDDFLYPYQAREIAAYADAVKKSGRPIELSLSPGRELSMANLPHLREHSSMWRISDDLWDRWDDIEAQFTRLARWAPESGPDGWADADMLPLGRIGIRAERGDDRLCRLTAAEQQTMMSLWVIARSPLMVGGDLPTSPRATIDLLTNRDVLEVLTATKDNREVLRDGDLVAWTATATAPGRPGSRYAAVFWLGDEPQRVTVPLLSIGARESDLVTDLWTGGTLCPDSLGLPLELDSHGSRLLRLDDDR